MISKYYILVFACMLYLAQGSLLEELAGFDYHGGKDDVCCNNAKKLEKEITEISEIYIKKGDRSKIPGLKANMTKSMKVVAEKCGPEV